MKTRIVKITKDVGNVRYFAQVRKWFLFIPYWINVIKYSDLSIHTEPASMQVYSLDSAEEAQKSLAAYKQRQTKIKETIFTSL